MKTTRLLPLIALALLVCRPSAAAAPATGPASRPFGDRVDVRGGLANARVKFAAARAGRVAFLGGSITEMEGYRPMVADLLRRRFPGTAFTFVNAGVSSTCSTTGAFRLAADVLGDANGDPPPDLLFVEFAVNDDQDAAHTRAECVRGLEGIVRHARAANPDIDIVVTFFVNEGMLATLQAGKTPLTVEAHTAVADRYGLPTIDLAREVADEVTAGALTWKQYGGVHPAPFGNAIGARMIDELFDRAWAGPRPPSAAAVPHVSGEPLDPLNYERGRFVDPKAARAGDGWALGVPDWAALPGAKRERFTRVPLLCATAPGAALTLEFEGTAVGAYVLAGPDAGAVEAGVDGGPPRAVDLYHRFSAGLHYPRTVMFAADLKPGKHTLALRVSNETASGGHAVRVLQFVAN